MASLPSESRSVPVNRVDQVLWLAGFVGHLCLVIVLLVRHRITQLPVFSGFVAANLIRTVVLFSVSRSGRAGAYFVTYWTLAVVDVFLQCCLAYEIAHRVFRPAGDWARDVKRGWFRLLSGASVFAAGLALAAPIPPETWQEGLIDRGNLFSTVFVAQIFVGMIVLSSTAGLPFRTHAGRIAQAFGFYAIFELLLQAAIFVHGGSYGRETDLVLYRLRSVLYLACVIFWSVSLWHNSPKSKSSSEQITALLREAGLVFSPALRRGDD